jgi:hypothetical protein
MVYYFISIFVVVLDLPTEGSILSLVDVRFGIGRTVQLTGVIRGRMVVRLKTLAERHWSAEAILGGSVVLGILVGAFVGYLVGMAIQNVGASVPLGALAGLIAGLIMGTKASSDAD